MIPAIVLSQGEAVFGSPEIEPVEPLRALRADSPPFDVVDAKLDAERILYREKDMLPLVVVTYENLTETRIDEINANSLLNPIEA